MEYTQHDSLKMENQLSNFDDLFMSHHFHNNVEGYPNSSLTYNNNPPLHHHEQVPAGFFDFDTDRLISIDDQYHDNDNSTMLYDLNIFNDINHDQFTLLDDKSRIFCNQSEMMSYNKSTFPGISHTNPGQLDFQNNAPLQAMNFFEMTGHNKSTFPGISCHQPNNPQLEVQNNVTLEEMDFFVTKKEGSTSNNNGKVNRVRSKSSRIEMDEIKKYFHIPISRAAKEMNVGLTVLKKRCRELNIMRWPHRKIKSLKCLITNVKDMGLTNEIEMLEEHKRMLEKIPQMELTEKTKKLRQACFKANYKKRKSQAQALALALASASTSASGFY